jgi:hypothetical protein
LNAFSRYRLEVYIHYVYRLPSRSGIFNSPVKGLNWSLRAAEPPEALLGGIQKAVPLTEPTEAVIDYSC